MRVLRELRLRRGIVAPGDELGGRETGDHGRFADRPNCGNDQLMEPDAAANVLQMLRNYFAPDTLEMVNQDVVRSAHFDRTTRMMDE